MDRWINGTLRKQLYSPHLEKFQQGESYLTQTQPPSLSRRLKPLQMPGRGQSAKAQSWASLPRWVVPGAMGQAEPSSQGAWTPAPTWASPTQKQSQHSIWHSRVPTRSLESQRQLIMGTFPQTSGFYGSFQTCTRTHFLGPQHLDVALASRNLCSTAKKMKSL